MVCGSLRYLVVESLREGAGAEAYARSGMTMGMPLHPWANRLSGFRHRVAGKEVALPRGENLIPLDDVGLPIHGAMPVLMPWEVGRLTPTALTGRLRWTSGALLRLFPSRTSWRLRPESTTVRSRSPRTGAPVSEESVPVSLALIRAPAGPRKSRPPSQWRSAEQGQPGFA
jgi:hypothetical protein